jgi:predicted transcriptional regulator of viral defense system
MSADEPKEQDHKKGSMTMTSREKALEMLAQADGALALEEFTKHGIHHETLRRIVASEVAERPAYGFYSMVGKIDIVDLSWVGFALAVPDGVIGMLTAAVRHGMTQETPAFMQAFIPRKFGGEVKIGGDCNDEVDVISSRNEEALTFGVETIVISGTPVNITGKERTLVDLFIYSAFNNVRASAARIPDETFLDCLERCCDDPSFSFERMHEIARRFGCDRRMNAVTKPFKFRRAPL